MLIEAYRIRIDHANSDIGLCESQHPVIGWAVSGAEQRAFRIRVAYLDKMLWDTDWLETPDSQIVYEGNPLPVGELCIGSIQLKDASGNEGPEKPFTLVYGTLDDWKAAWLADPNYEDGRPTLYTGEIFARKSVDHAAIFYSALGYARMNINGSPLDHNRMNPAFSEFEKRCYYVLEPEVELKKGKNIIQALVADGWRNPNQICYKHTGRIPEYAGDVLFSASVHVVYVDGTDEWFHTNKNWQCSHTATTYSNIFMGETYDASRQNDKPVQVRIAECPTLKMCLQTLPSVQDQEVYSPVCIWELEPDNFVVDFGQNIAGVCELRLPDEMSAGQTITIEHMEQLDDDGSLYLPNLRYAACKDTYIASGDENDLDDWCPQFTYHGFRYAQIKGYGRQLRKDDIVAVSFYTDIVSSSSFCCGNPQINAIHKLVVQTEKANIHSILTDCPQRDERMGWMNDATVRFEETPYNFDVGHLFPKVVRDCLDVQDEEGRITCTVPFASFGARPADPVCSSFLVAGWQSYMHTGNADILKEAFDGFDAWDKYLDSRSENGIVQYTYYGDWASPAYACAAPEDARSAATPGIFMSTGYHYYNNVLLTKMAQAIGRDPAPYQARAEKVRAAFLKEWWNEETGVVCTGSQACQAFALWLDILPEEGREKAARIMQEDLVARNYQFTTGNLCTRYLMDELTRYGYIEDAWKLLLKEDYPSFGFMLENEATTVWERFELKKDPGMNSHNHPMYGAVGYWFYAWLAGIRPVSAGWKKCIIAPSYPEKLLSCQATVESPRGDVSVRWVKKYGKLHLYVQVPCGVEAEIAAFDGPVTVGGGFYHFEKDI